MSIVALGLALIAAAAPYRAAIVIGHGRAPNPALTPLEFADDDAVRYAELFDLIADRTELLTVLDDSTQRLFPGFAARARAPERRAVLETIERVYADLEKMRAEGRRTELYFVLIGHGEVDATGEGLVHLQDGPFRRSDLQREVIERSPAAATHVIVDACHSYFLVHARGEGASPSYADLIRAHAEADRLRARPTAGVILSTSGAKESHEWEGFGAGVFSHQVRSALSGAADVNGDGSVDYAELHAFIAAANAQVEDVRARSDIFLSAPAGDRRASLASLANGRFKHFLRVPRGRDLRFYLEDDRGVRYADAHADGEAQVIIGLVPRPAYYVRDAKGEKEIRVDLESAGGQVSIEPEDFSAAPLARRGAIADAFREKLFAEPFGPRFANGFSIAQGYPRAGEHPLFAPDVPDHSSRIVSLEGVRRRLKRLEVMVGDDPALRDRLLRLRPKIGAAMARGAYAEAAALLRAAEGAR